MGVQVKLLSNCYKAPKRMTRGSAGFDFYCCEDVTIPQYDTVLVKLGVKTKFDNDMYMQLKSRSSLEMKGLTLKAGVIDSDYRDEICAMFYNGSCGDFKLKKGDRICQGIFMKICVDDMVEVESFDDKNNERKGGFGSTNL